MTLGMLKDVYGQIVAPTGTDDLTRRALESVLRDRNDATHKSSDRNVTRRIRKNAPKHLFVFLNAVRALQ